jgi:WD40 repeat protein/serine/threonine protein kinase/DNA-binding XRE family transcriptional regulator
MVRERRRALDLTQDELARRVGCAPVTVRKIEYGELRPSHQVAERLAMALAVPIDEREGFIRAGRAVAPASREPAAPRTSQPVPAEPIALSAIVERGVRGYQIGEVLGSGGFGAVYRAVQPLIEREVAIKIILPHLADRPAFIRRFEAEAQLVARLEHPHIVPLYDYWRDPGVAFLVMRYVRGGSLQQLLEQGALPAEQALALFEQVAAALHVAHRAGVIHRDLKPANILLDPDGNAYLADFGIAKELARPAGELTFEGAFVGSPAYSSPEQIHAAPITAQSDIYSLGLLLYELLSGQRAFEGPTPAAYFQQHLTTSLPPLPAHRQLPLALDRAIQRATAKVPAARYPDVPAFVADVREALAHTPPNGAARTVPVLTPAAPTLVLDIDDSDSPYQGLRAFGEADAANFFGREALVQQLLTRLSESSDLHRFLAVIGPSGSGKSSAVRAGLLPALRQGALPGSEHWYVVAMLPGALPLDALSTALLRIAPVAVTAEDLRSLLGHDSYGLLHAARLLLPQEPDSELVLLIDQFEELFTLVADEATRADFLERIVAATLDERSRIRVIITLRADFIDRPLQYVDFGELLKRRGELVLPLTPDELEQAIIGPARRAGLVLEDGMATALLSEVLGQPGALPLLQHALAEIFLRRRGRTLTVAAAREIGGVTGALARSADSLYTSLTPAGQSAARQLFLHLVTPGEGVEDTRRRVRLTELDLADTRVVIDAYAAARLLTLDYDPRSHEATVEVAHEALIRSWPRLRGWLTENREALRVRHQVERATGEWASAGRDESYLASGTRLEQFAGLADDPLIALSAEERAYIVASLAARDERRAGERAQQERELAVAQQLATTERRTAQQLRRRAVWLSVALVLCGALALVASLFGRQAQASAQDAERQQRLAIVRELAAASVANLGVDQERSLLLAMQAVTTTASLHQPVLPEAEEALHRAVMASRILLRLPVAPEAGDRTRHSVSWSPDGARVAAPDGSDVVVIDAHTGAELLRLRGHKGAVASVHYSPDGARLASASAEPSVRIWDAASGQLLFRLDGNALEVVDLDWSPDGQRLATVGNDDIIRLWDTTTGTQLPLLGGYPYLLTAVAWSPDGTRIATGSDDSKAVVWDVATGKQLAELVGHSEPVRSLAWSPDGAKLVTVSDDASIKIWGLSLSGQHSGDAATLLQTLTGHTSSIYGVAFSKDGARMATVSFDRTAIIWDVASGRELALMAGFPRELLGVAFSPDGARLAVGGASNELSIWNAGPTREALTLSHTGNAGTSFGNVAYSPDGRLLATSGENSSVHVWLAESGKELLTIPSAEDSGLAWSPDSTRLVTKVAERHYVRLWDVATGRGLQQFNGHTDEVTSSSFSPDGRLLVTSSKDRTARIWEVTTGKQIQLLSHPDSVYAVAWSPDGARMATTSYDRGVRIWDVASGDQLLLMRGHTDFVDGLAWSPDGTRVVSGSFDGTARVWDAQSGVELFTIRGHTSATRRVAWSPDGASIATGSYDGTVKLWDATTGALKLSLSGGPSAVYDVAFSPDGTHLAATSWDATTHIYVLPVDMLIALARTRLTRTWTVEECQSLLHREQCPMTP